MKKLRNLRLAFILSLLWGVSLPHPAQAQELIQRLTGGDSVSREVFEKARQAKKAGPEPVPLVGGVEGRSAALVSDAQGTVLSLARQPIPEMLKVVYLDAEGAPTGTAGYARFIKGKVIDARPRVTLLPPPPNAAAVAATVLYTTERFTYIFPLKAPPSEAGKVSPDPTPNTPTNLLPGSTVRAGALNLRLSAPAQGTLATEGDSLRTNVSSTDGTEWRVTLSAGNLPLRDGQDYLLRFRARTDAPGDIAWFMMSESPEWHMVCSPERINIGPQWKTFEYRVTAKPLAGKPSRLDFLLGKRTGNVWLADVSLLLADAEPTTPVRVSPDLEQRIAAMLPTPQEDRWKQIPWRTNLVEACRESLRTGKPLYLWLMNGHPCGDT